MKYEKADWNWGYIGKVAATFVAAMGIATGAALFMPREKTLEKKIETAPAIAEPDSTDVIGAAEIIQHLQSQAVIQPASYDIARQLLGMPEPCYENIRNAYGYERDVIKDYSTEK